MKFGAEFGAKLGVDLGPLALAALACVACLPSATIEAPPEPALQPAADPELRPDECRALISSRGARGPRTVELRWDQAGERARDDRRGLVVGTADELFALHVRREPFDPRELYDGEDPELSCERDVVLARRLPDGVERPLIEAKPACAGTHEGEEVALESSLALVSALGPLLGWRARSEGLDPGRVGLLAYRSLDLSDSELALASEWLLEPSASMARPEQERGTCMEVGAPRTLAAVRGFALSWTSTGMRVRVGYDCCTWELNHGMCELEDPLPRPDPRLAELLPDEDGLLHSPEGCGSVGLDGKLRDRSGAVVGEHGVDPSELLGVVFLPAAHAFELEWLGPI